MHLSSVFSLALLALLTTSGCLGYTQQRGYAHHTSSGVGEAVALGILAGAAIEAVAERPSSREPEVVVQPRIYYVVTGPVAQPPPTPASPRDRVPTEEGVPSFDSAAARGALSAVDVSSCRAPGAAPGYGHAAVTFNPDGVISKVVIDEPRGLPAHAVQCIGDRLGAVTLAPFRGSLVTVGTVFRE